MFTSSRRIIWFLPVSLLVVVGCGLLAVFGTGCSATPAPTTPTPASTISLPNQASSLVWSADGNYLAAGTWSTAAGQTNASEVYVVDVNKTSVAATLKVRNWVEGVAFSPDGKWLAVAMRQSVPVGPEPAELVVFDVPGFTARFTAKAVGPENGFLDVAWAQDSKSLHAIDSQEILEGKAEVRHWTVPDFAEQTAHPIPAGSHYKALAVSPDNRTLAVAEEGTGASVLQIRLFDLDKGSELSSFKAAQNSLSPRLGFTADGKALGVFDQFMLTWWDPATGKSAKPGAAKLAFPPAGLSHLRSGQAVTLDGSWVARGYEHHRGLGDLGWDNRQNEFGAFIDVTTTATGKVHTWRVSDSSTAPAVAFSPDGTKLAATVQQANAHAILIWALPK
jgi:WD40 repeat protein